MGGERATQAERQNGAEKARPIEWGFRVRLMVKVGATLAIGALAPTCIFWALTADLVAHTYGDALADLSEFKLALARLALLSAGLQTALVGLLVIAVALLASHKISGPSIRFKRSIRQLAEGDFRQTVVFRHGDQDRSLPQAFHRLLERLRGRVDSANEVAGEMRAMKEALRQRDPTEALAAAEIAELVRRLRDQAGRLRAAGTTGVADDDS